MSDILKTVQEDFVGRLEAAAEFATVAVMAQRKNLTEADIATLLKTLKGRSGKIGVCVIVQMPVVDVIDPNLPGPRTQLLQSLLVIEHPTLNASGQGTGLSAEQLALAALQLFHHYVPAGVTQVFTGVQNAIVPADLDGLRAYTVTVGTFLQLAAPGKVSRPVIALSAPTVPTTITLTCPTVGASIHYTTDGSYPSAANPAATLYTVPIEQTTAAILRVAASKAGLQQSDIAQLTLT